MRQNRSSRTIHKGANQIQPKLCFLNLHLHMQDIILCSDSPLFWSKTRGCSNVIIMVFRPNTPNFSPGNWAKDLLPISYQWHPFLLVNSYNLVRLLLKWVKHELFIKGTTFMLSFVKYLMLHKVHLSHLSQFHCLPHKIKTP